MVFVLQAVGAGARRTKGATRKLRPIRFLAQPFVPAFPIIPANIATTALAAAATIITGTTTPGFGRGISSLLGIERNRDLLGSSPSEPPWELSLSPLRVPLEALLTRRESSSRRRRSGYSIMDLEARRQSLRGRQNALLVG